MTDVASPSEPEETGSDPVSDPIAATDSATTDSRADSAPTDSLAATGSLTPTHSGTATLAAITTADPRDEALAFWRLFDPRFYLHTWALLDREAEAERQARHAEGRTFDRRPLFAFVGGAILLTLMEYFGDPSVTYPTLLAWLVEHEIVGDLLTGFDVVHPWYELSAHGYWALWRFFGFGVFAVPFIWLGGERLRDQYLSPRGFLAHLPIYLVAFVLVLGCVAVVSFDEGFQSYYPFYGRCHRSWADLLIWEFLYFLQFLGLELFFRGWWLKACKAQLGSAAIFAMIVPYVMIHFGKELPETLGAIVAGVVLGTLAMRTKSIWGGLLVHTLVAISMDVAVLLQTTGLPTGFWPE